MKNFQVQWGKKLFLQAEQQPYRDAAFLSQVLVAMSIVTPVTIRAVTKLHELVTKPGLEKDFSA